MAALLVTAVGSGAVLDRITLDDQGHIAYRTGAARDIVESRRRHLDDGTDDAELLASLAGWSNGYLRITDDEQTEPPAGDADQDDAAAVPAPPPAAGE
jgi:hypothetical protein